MKTKKTEFPFTAMVGQEVLKRALILNVVNPKVGGVLIRGEKGTGKSIAVRALADILPPIEVVEGCKYNCDPKKPDKFCNDCKALQEKGEIKATKTPTKIVNLPLNITEDRLVGSIDIERILNEGVRSFEPGLLAEAHRGILYVDEINLLEDNVVDVLLDAAAMGMVTIEREGISLNYPSEFIIIGSMNPEEGELRPQLLDRLALQAEVTGIHNVEQRVEVMMATREFSLDPVVFRDQHRDKLKALREEIIRARTLMPKVTTPDSVLAIITKIGIDFNIDGHRGDIIIERTARTNAAFEGRTESTPDDVILSAEMALPHRMRKQPFEEESFSAEMLRRLVRKYETDGIR
ncbi:MAG: ATP-binding protein [Candidatus Thermoplasmatota archaeon]|nr:magnesium chelatase [Euryarchaeota archaeon]MBU4071799.1 ATP-binding protein [Candidatus Thermoplasmatota archaeon]MBU4144290.1 ATP-binding protein [Candidatus Thermoplasmatota archaeon]MBU4592620.1 ATP-binding protein [Candidatus Thermoplasmatota archaeon]